MESSPIKADPLLDFHLPAYNVPGWVIAIYCLNYYPSPWTGWNSESCFGAKPIKP